MPEPTDQEIQKLVSRYLAGDLSLQDFQGQFVGFYFQARNDRRNQSAANALCDAVIVPLGELSRGDRSESSFREELANAIGPFEISGDRTGYRRTNMVIIGS